MKERKPTPILLLRRLPFRLSAEESAQMLNFHDTDSIGVLIAARMMKPLGNPPKGAPVWFATSTIVKYGNDLDWLDRATKTLRDNIRAKNAKKRE